MYTVNLYKICCLVSVISKFRNCESKSQVANKEKTDQFPLLTVLGFDLKKTLMALTLHPLDNHITPCLNHFSTRCNIYISRLCYDVSVHLSVGLSVTEVHWHIMANLGFKFRSHFTAHCGRRAACGRIISHHASQC